MVVAFCTTILLKRKGNYLRTQPDKEVAYPFQDKTQPQASP